MFATVEDLEKRWRPLSNAEKAQAEVLLGDAELLVVSAAGDEVDPDRARMVVCAVVKRAMTVVADGVSSAQQTAGPFSQSLTYSNPQGNLYLTKAEKRLLGVRQRAFTVDLTTGGVDVP